jgi:hypothetical protein
MRRRVSVLLFAALASCANGRTIYDPFFLNVSQFSGRTVSVCGYMIDSYNIFESPKRDDYNHRAGLSIITTGPLKLPHKGRICVEGSIEYIGCQTGPLICVDEAFDYGIRIIRVLDNVKHVRA